MDDNIQKSIYNVDEIKYKNLCNTSFCSKQFLPFPTVKNKNDNVAILIT